VSLKTNNDFEKELRHYFSGLLCDEDYKVIVGIHKQTIKDAQLETMLRMDDTFELSKVDRFLVKRFIHYQNTILKLDIK
jgi:hypothetical protein